MTEKSPNILLITCHDLGRHLGCYGIPTVRSPHLDALAADGVLFTQAFCSAPQCSPSRASLFTGRYPHSNGVMGLTHANFAWDLSPDEEHLAQALQRAGYRTANIGVHHESRTGDPERIARRCGFDEISLGGRGEAVSDRAVDWLAGRPGDERPFYLEVGYVEPHRLGIRRRGDGTSAGDGATGRIGDGETGRRGGSATGGRGDIASTPVAPSPRRPVPPSTPAAPVAPSPLDYLGFVGDYIQPDDALGVFVPSYLRDEPQAREELAELQGAVRYVDAAIGRVLAALQSAGLEENTLVLFTTDHGVALPRAKCAVYDPGLATALILRLPARDWASGRRFAEPISNVDVFPTLLDLVGLPVNPRVQGRSFLPLLDGREYRPRDCVFGEMTYHDHYDPRRCIRTRTHKLIVNFAAARSFMDPTQSWRPRTAPAVPAAPELEYHPVVELYDLVADPNEWHDVAEQPGYAAIRRELLTRLHDWMRATDDPLLRGAVTSPLHHWAVEALESAGKQ